MSNNEQRVYRASKVLIKKKSYFGTNKHRKLSNASNRSSNNNETSKDHNNLVTVWISRYNSQSKGFGNSNGNHKKINITNISALPTHENILSLLDVFSWNESKYIYVEVTIHETFDKSFLMELSEM